MMKLYSIRAHHGLCTLFFRGFGYDDNFSRNMEAVIRQLQKNPQIIVSKEPDDICRACPHKDEKQCQAFLKVENYDRRVLDFCQLTPESELSWEQFRSRVLETILLPGHRRNVCGDCEWNHLCETMEEETIFLYRKNKEG